MRQRPLRSGQCASLVLRQGCSMFEYQRRTEMGDGERRTRTMSSMISLTADLTVNRHDCCPSCVSLGRPPLRLIPSGRPD